MKKWTWLSILLVAAMMTACGSDDDNKNTNTEQDAGATAKDSTAAGDTAVAKDSTAAGDTAAGPVCMASPYTPTADDGFGKGCSEMSDLQYLGAMQADSKKGDAFRKQITDCLLTGGCSGKGDPKTPEGVKAIQACTTTCILDKAEKGISSDCANCYAFNGTCGFTKCLSKCAVDSGSDACKECMACNCDPALIACQQLPKK